MPELSGSDDSKKSPRDADDSQTVVHGVLGTIQVAVGILSALVLLLGVGGAYFLGSELRSLSANTKAEIDAISKTSREQLVLLANAAQQVNETTKSQISNVTARSQAEMEKLAAVYSETLETKIDSLLAE